jgi:hypothetical protein
MVQQISETLTKMIGLQCCEAKIGYADTLRLGFGKKVFYTHGTLKGVFHGEWDFSSASSAWRIVENSKLICGSYDSEEESDPVLKRLVGATLTNFTQISPLDFLFEFSNGIAVNILGQSGTDTILEVFAPEDKYLEYLDGNWTESSSLEPMQGLTNEESIIENYSKKCHERWETVVPKEQQESQCRDCVYFRSISGRFYFWDYGLCSNEISDFDGKVVAVWSGCPCFGTTFPSIKE